MVLFNCLFFFLPFQPLFDQWSVFLGEMVRNSGVPHYFPNSSCTALQIPAKGCKWFITNPRRGILGLHPVMFCLSPRGGGNELGSDQEWEGTRKSRLTCHTFSFPRASCDVRGHTGGTPRPSPQLSECTIRPPAWALRVSPRFWNPKGTPWVLHVMIRQTFINSKNYNMFLCYFNWFKKVKLKFNLFGIK